MIGANRYTVQAASAADRSLLSLLEELLLNKTQGEPLQLYAKEDIRDTTEASTTG